MTPRGYFPDFDLDRDYGEDGEDTVRDVLGLATNRIEVKHKSYADDKFYVELEHDPGGRGQYKPSGLTTTKAEYFTYVIADTGVIVFIPVPYLRQRLER